MRHRKAGVKLGRTSSHRNAMFRNMVTSLLKHDRIQTTDTKAKELRRWVDHVITLAKRGDLHARRQALSIVKDKATVHKLFDRAQELFGNRAGGYTRLTKVGRRAGDAAPMTLVELIVPEKEEKKKKKKTVTKPAQTAEAQPATGDDQAPQPAEQQQQDVSPVETQAAVEEVEDRDAAMSAQDTAVDAEEDKPAGDDDADAEGDKEA